MSKVTSKFQVTLPRSLARAHAIKPGSHITFESAGTMIQVRVEPGKAGDSSPEERVRSFDMATARQRDRDAGALQRVGKTDGTRGWTRAGLYEGRG